MAGVGYRILGSSFNSYLITVEIGALVIQTPLPFCFYYTLSTEYVIAMCCISVRKKGEPIRGGKGTLKRKKDLRAFLDEQNEDYEDDLFNSSPLVKKIPKSILNCDFDKNVSDIFGLNHNFFTPVAGRSILGTPSTNIRAVLASVRKGPSGLDSIMEETPISTKRQKADVLIKKFNGRQKKSIPVYEKKESSIDIELSTLPVKSLFTPVTQPSISVDENDEDDGKHLYYWDDDE
ncbi:hypothetical protein Btru_002994 [Bulinus truncatus]|nr:hypothetical protein Btru_002994 [Bulinus truncatus]